MLRCRNHPDVSGASKKSHWRDKQCAICDVTGSRPNQQRPLNIFRSSSTKSPASFLEKKFRPNLLTNKCPPSIQFGAKHGQSRVQGVVCTRTYIHTELPFCSPPLLVGEPKDTQHRHRHTRCGRGLVAPYYTIIYSPSCLQICACPGCRLS